jgi:protein-S-isoprenylcysteine O-methyltransferase Ste14
VPWFDWLVFVVWIAYFTIPFFWLLVHPFTGFWQRRRGRTYAAYGIAIWLGFLGLFLATGSFWFEERFARGWPLAAAGLALLAVEPLMISRIEGELDIPILVGWAERDPGQFPPRLVESGIYARVRHPRYLSAMAVLMGTALLSGSWRLLYLSVLSVPLYYLLTWVEERELLRRIGAPYAEYRRRVPRFFPRVQA